MKKRMLIGSGVAALTMVAGVAVWLVFFTNPPPPKQEIIKQEAYIPPPPMAAAKSPIVFTDITAATGIRFNHHTGAFIANGKDSRYMPETIGSGVVLFDYDGDGDLDIFAVNSSDFPGHVTSKQTPTSHLYRNDGNMRFTDVTQAA